MYRTAASRKPADTEIPCRACGIRTTVNLEQARNEIFTCENCGREQPVLRDDTTVEKLKLIPTTGGKYEELVPLMREFGHDEKASQVSVTVDGIVIMVSISLNSGTVTGIEMAAAAPDLFDMRFVREDGLHRKAKAKGISVEAQTGDAAFDDAVYIESKMSADSVRAVLAPPAVRKAILTLLSHVGSIHVSDGHVKIDIAKSDAAFDVDRIKERLALLRVIAGAPRPFDAVEMPVSPKATLAKVFMYAFSPIAIVTALYGGSYTPLDKTPWLITVLSGFVLAAIFWPIYRRLLSGRSTSHRDLVIARVTSIIACPCFMSGALFIANATFDSAPAQAVDLKVLTTSIDNDDDSGNKMRVVAADATGRRYDYYFPPPPGDQKPTVVRVSWRKGAFGWRWEGPPRFLYYDDPPPPNVRPLP